MDIVKQPHDRFFKEVFSSPKVMKDFITNYLPPELAAFIDINSLILENSSFIDPELKENQSDLLFKTTINHKESYLYLLFEHKSYLSSDTPLQLLRYMVKIWENKINKASSRQLPLIIPVVIYHGKEKWNIEKKFIKMVEGTEELPPEIIKYIPDYEYILSDLTTYEAERLKGNILLTATIKLLKAVYQQRDIFLKQVEETLTALDKQGWDEDSRRYFITIVIYIISARSDLELKDIHEAAKNISPERSADIMTIAEKLYKEGMEKGIEKGMEKGIEKGRLETQRKTAKNFLRQGLSPEQIAEATELPLNEVWQLKKELDN